VLLSGLLQPVFAVPGSSCGSVDRLTVALRFAEALYPELKGNEFSISLSAGSGTFIDSATEADGLQIRFDKPIWHPPGRTNEQSDALQAATLAIRGIELPLHLYFSFIDIHGPVAPRHLTCQPFQFKSDAGFKQMVKVFAVLNAHPEWSDEEELTAARKLGLRYGPEDKSAILQMFPFKELAEFYGKLRIKDVKFSMNAGQKCTGCSFAAPSWELSVSDDTGGSLIMVEPFFGKITSISK